MLTGIAVPHGKAAASGMKLNKKKVTLKVGKKIKLKLKNAKKKVTWIVLAAEGTKLELSVSNAKAGCATASIVL